MHFEEKPRQQRFVETIRRLDQRLGDTFQGHPRVHLMNLAPVVGTLKHRMTTAYTDEVHLTPEASRVIRQMLRRALRAE